MVCLFKLRKVSLENVNVRWVEHEFWIFLFVVNFNRRIQSEFVFRQHHTDGVVVSENLFFKIQQITISNMVCHVRFEYLFLKVNQTSFLSTSVVFILGCLLLDK